MNVILCMDDLYGMMYHKRRISRDSLVFEDIGKYTKNVHCSPYSERILKENGLNPIVSDDFLSIAGENEYCFVEDRALSMYEGKIKNYIVYRWNRRYPSDLKIDIDFEKRTLLSQTNFRGKAHEKITKEIYQ